MMKIISTLGLEEQYRLLLDQEFPKYEIGHIMDLSILDESELKEVEVLLTYGNDIPGNLIKKMSSLRWIHSGQSGIETMPREVLSEKGIFVTNSRGINSITIAEYVICMLLNIERNTYRFYDAYKAKSWDTNTRLDEISGKTIGIIGVGNVGREIAKRAKAFDMTVYGVNQVISKFPNIDMIFTSSELNKVAADCDYIVLCVPLTDETYHMIDSRVINKMKKSAILVNVGRGAVIKMDDFIYEMQNHTIKGAIIDVFEQEPLEVDNALWELENVMITPHIAGDRQKSYMPRMMKILCHNLRMYPNVDMMENHVDLKLGY